MSIPFLASEQAVTRDIPNAIVEQREAGYLVEYGVRANDEALVIHMFPLPETTDTWERLDMAKRLERALPQAFDIDRITAGYESEFDSFYIVAGGYGRVPDPRGVARRFLSLVDAQ